MNSAGQTFRLGSFRSAALAAAVLMLGASDIAFAQGTAPPRQRGGAGSLGGLSSDSKEPIKIDADKLDVLDKENKAVFSGNVVAVQGETTVRCTVMTVLYEGRGAQGGEKGAKTAAAAQPAAASQPATQPAAAPSSAPAAAGAPSAPGAPNANDSSIKRILCKGPVTVVSKTQAATSDNAEFDRARNLVIMTGNVALNDGPNVTRGQKLTYDTVTGVANVEGGRVQGLFVPNSTDASKTDAGKPGAKPSTN